MFTYTTCTDCGGLLHITGDDTVHCGCIPRLTDVERLAAEWRTAVEADDAHPDALQARIDEIDSRPPRLSDAALIYARWGWPVFPLRSHAKRPATRNGFKDATTDSDRIASWWRTNPHYNIGLPTGHAFDVIDIDPPAGAISYVKLIAREDPHTGRGPIPDCHGRVASASGGIHLYVKPTGKGNAVGIAPGIDHRGVGGYVVAPPSTLGKLGRSWSWTVKPSPTIKGGDRG